MVADRATQQFVDGQFQSLAFDIPQRQIERAGGNHFPVVGAIGVRRSVEQGAGPLQRRKVAVIVMFRSFEHQMLEEVCETGAARLFVLRADVIPHVHGHHRQLVIFVNDDVEPVF